MLKELIKKEFLEQIYSFRFLVSAVLIVILIMIGVIIQIGDYNKQVDEFNSNRILYENEVKSRESFHELLMTGTKADRPPLPLQIFYSGTEKKLNKSAEIINYFRPYFQGELFFNPLIKLFPNVDLLFIVGIVMSLLAFIFSYDAISGEREKGTLKLLMSYSIPRDLIIVAKWIGGLASLLVPYFIGVVAAVLIVLFSKKVVLSFTDFEALFWTLIVSSIFIAVMYSIGILVSIKSRSSAGAITILLFIWVLMILVIPNISPYIIDQIHPIPSQSMIENEIKFETAAVGAQMFREMERKGSELLGISQYKEEVVSDSGAGGGSGKSASSVSSGGASSRTPSSRTSRRKGSTANFSGSSSMAMAGGNISDLKKDLQEIEQKGCERYVDEKINEYKDKLPEGMKIPDDIKERFLKECENNISSLKAQIEAGGGSGSKVVRGLSGSGGQQVVRRKKTEDEIRNEAWQKMRNLDAGKIKELQEFIDRQFLDLTKKTSTISNEKTKEYDRKLSSQIKFTKYLSRLSPYAALVYATTDIAGTGIQFEDHLMKSLIEYQRQFNDYVDSKINAPAEERTRQIWQLFTEPEYDLSDMPSFKYGHQNITDRFASAAVDIVVLCLFVLVLFMVSFISFLRMDIIG